MLVLGGVLGAQQGGAVRSVVRKSPQQDNIVISEFRTRGPNGGNDEFIEIFNPTNSTISIANWEIRASNNTGGVGTIYTFSEGTEIQRGQHFLVANASDSGYSGGVDPDVTYINSGISNTGGLALSLPDSTLVDQVGMSPGSTYKEGSTLSPMSDDLDQSYERRPGGPAGNCTDSDSNAADFQLRSLGSDPQNKDSDPTTACLPATATPTQTGTTTPTQTTSGTPTSSGTPTDTGTPTSTATSTNTPTPTGSATATATSTSTGTPTSTATASPTMTVTLSAPSHLVISEFRSLGPNGAGDEFVELYNPSGAAVNIGSWMIRNSSSCGSSLSTLVTIPSNTVLQAGQHYLIAATGSSASGADQTYTASIADDGGLALANGSGTIVDQAGMCVSTEYREGTFLTPLAGTSNQSYERKPGGSTSCYDTNNNATDFAHISPANPQNRASPIVLCAGVLTSTPTSTFTRTPTRTPTRTATTVPGDVVINEILPHPDTDWNGDGTANTGDEYIELVNMGTKSITLNNWKLDDGDGGSSPYTLPSTTLLPRQIVLFYHSETGISLSDGGDSVRLFKPDGRTADSLAYPVVTATDQTWCRLPDGNGVWAFVCQPSPGRPNAPFEFGTPTPKPTPMPKPEGTVIPSTCQIDSAPQPVLFAECDSPGSKMWGETGDRVIWLESRWKYDVFVE